jgi:hypothetical protein
MVHRPRVHGDNSSVSVHQTIKQVDSEFDQRAALRQGDGKSPLRALNSLDEIPLGLVSMLVRTSTERLGIYSFLAPLRIRSLAAFGLRWLRRGVAHEVAGQRLIVVHMSCSFFLYNHSERRGQVRINEIY